MMLGTRTAAWAKIGGVPNGYRLVKSIVVNVGEHYSSGNCLVDTGIFITKNDISKYVFKPPAIHHDNYYPIGSSDGDQLFWNYCVGFILSESTVDMTAFWDMGDIYYGSLRLPYEIVRLESIRGNQYLNGNLWDFGTVKHDSFPGVSTLSLGGCLCGTTPSYCDECEIFSFFVEGKCDMIPVVRIEDDVPCMWCRVRNEIIEITNYSRETCSYTEL